MDFLFISMALGCAGFLVKILMNYRNEIPQWKSRVKQAEAERYQYAEQVKELLKSRESSSQRSKEIDAEIKSLEQMRDDLRSGIESTKQEMARKGRIIMHRNTGDS